MDNRTSVRISVDLDSEIRTGDRVFKGTVLNCSLSGLFLRTNEKVSDGDLLDIRIFLPGIADPVTATSRVIWTDWNEKNTPGFGIHFLSLTDDQAQILRVFLYD